MRNNSSIFNFDDASKKKIKKLFLRILLLASLTVIPVLAAKIFIPIEWYSFRCWEPMVNAARSDCFKTTSFFYANQKCIKKNAQGDLGHHTKYAEYYDTEWETDPWGNRNTNYSPDKDYPIVIVGDSDIVGAGVTQSDTLASKLSNKVNANVYSWGHVGINPYLKSSLFKEKPPKIVILAHNERNLIIFPKSSEHRDLYLNIPDPEFTQDIPKEKKAYCTALLQLNPESQKTLGNIAHKPWLPKHLFNILYRKITNKPVKGTIIDHQSGMLFNEESLKMMHFYEENRNFVSLIIQGLASYEEYFQERGIVFIYMPIPTKAHVYWHLIPEDQKKDMDEPTFLSESVRLANEMNIPSIDLLPVFKEAVKNGALLFHKDDMHWNAEAVELAAETIKKMLS